MFNISEFSSLWAKQEGLSNSLLTSIGSTNDYAKENLSNLKAPHIIFANEQTNGRGRGSNTWISPQNGHGLLCSFIFKLEKAPQHIAAPCFGWAVHRALSENFNLNFSVKVPNDIYIDDSKIGGLLLESVSQGNKHHLILGLGINVFSHPSVDHSNSIVNFIKNNEIQENQWKQFLSHLVSLSSQAAIASQEENISKTIMSELEPALKKYQHNEIENLLTDGKLKLSDGSITNWRDL